MELPISRNNSGEDWEVKEGVDENIGDEDR